MKLFVLLVFVAGCFAKPSVELFDHDLDEFWLSYKQIHGKSYEGSDEFVRRINWERNLRYIQKHNLEADMGLHTHRLGMNEHGDLSDEEYSILLKGFSMPNATKASSPIFMAPENTEAAKMVDWREKGYVTPVKNQGHCGSCWAFSATGSLEGQHFRKTGRLVSLSEQQLVDCANKLGAHGCKGGAMDIAFEYIKQNHGIDTEASYPYTERDGLCHFKTRDIGATDMGFVNIPRDDEEALKHAVSSVGPISVAIDASTRAFRFYKEGVFTDRECSDRKLDHGVLVVGYGEEMDEEYWLVKNSWGETWGHQGYIMMRRNFNNMCGIATMASYPQV